MPSFPSKTSTSHVLCKELRGRIQDSTYGLSLNTLGVGLHRKPVHNLSWDEEGQKYQHNCGCGFFNCY